MKTITIYGASDDSVEIEGAIKDEFTHYDEDQPMKMSFSEGTVLTVEYASGGLWRINRIHAGSASYQKEEATDADSDNYSDKVTLTGDIEWVVAGKYMARAV